MITVSALRMIHITVGDASGGGHMHGSRDPTKSKFPADWTALTIETELLRVARAGTLARVPQPSGSDMIRGLDTEGKYLTVIVRGDNVITAWPG